MKVASIVILIWTVGFAYMYYQLAARDKASGENSTFGKRIALGAILYGILIYVLLLLKYLTI